MLSKKEYIYLVLIILLQSCLLIIYMNNKIGYYFDELWSYSLSNSLNDIPIYSSHLTDNKELNLYNRWIPGNFFHKILTIQNDERFNYKKVKYNHSLDSHPPFYCYLLHTICSFFPDSFSKWYGLSLNLTFFVLTQILLFFISKELFSEKIALLCVAYYGFTSAAINTFVYIRMYSLSTLFFLLLTFIYIKALENKNQKLTLGLVVVFSFLGSYTQYHFMIYVFYLTAIFDFICFCKKKYQCLLFVSFAALIGVSLVYFLYPAVVAQLTSSPRGIEAINQFNIFKVFFLWQKETFEVVLSQLIGLNPFSAETLSLFLNICYLLFYLFVIIIVFYTFLIKQKLNNSNIVFLYINKASELIRIAWENYYTHLLLLISMGLFVSTMGQTINYAIMGIYWIRYFTPILPLVSLTIVVIVNWFAVKLFSIKYRKLLIISLLSLFCISGQVSNLIFNFPEKEDNIVEANRLDLYKSVQGSNVFFRAANDTNKVHELSVVLQYCNKCYIYNEPNEWLQALKDLNPKEKNLVVVPFSMGSSFKNNIYSKYNVNFKHLATSAVINPYEIFEIKINGN